MCLRHLAAALPDGAGTAAEKGIRLLGEAQPQRGVGELAGEGLHAGAIFFTNQFGCDFVLVHGNLPLAEAK